MKKRISLVLAIVLVAATLLTAIPFSAVAKEFKVPKYVATVNGRGVVTLDLAVTYANASKEDVVIELLKDVEVGGALVFNPTFKKEGNVPVKITLDGNGHTVKTATGNCFRVGGDGSNPSGTNNIVIEDLVIDYSGAGSVMQIYSGGEFVLENVVMNCTQPLTWTALNMNIGNNGLENPANVTMKNVYINTLAIGQPDGSGDPSVMRLGNSSIKDDANSVTGKSDNGSPASNIYMENCHLTAAGGEVTDKNKDVIGLHFTSCNATVEMVNCSITTKNDSVVYFASDASSKIWADKDGKPTKQPLKLVDTTLTVTDKLNEGQEFFKRREWAEEITTENKFTPVTDFTVYVGDAAPVELTTIDDAMKAINEATGDVTLVINKDITLAAAIAIKNAAGNAVVVDAKGNTITATAGNAIQFGAAGDEQNITLKNAVIDYNGVGSVVQIYTAGTATLEDVVVKSAGKLNYCAVNALNNADTTLTLNITDCFITGADEGNNDNAGLVRTGNGGNIVNLTIDGTVVVATGEGTTKPVTPLNITSTKAVVVVKNSALIATGNSAILVSADVETKVTVEKTLIMNQTEAVEVISKKDLVELDEKTADYMFGGPQPVETTPAETTPEEKPVETTPSENVETTPAGGETTTAPVVATKGGCGGIAIVAQLVALVCAAAAVIVIKKK